MFEVIGVFFELFAWSAQSSASDQRHTRVLSTLVDVARALEGSAYKPWFRKPRVLGRVGGSQVELIYRGRGRVELTLSEAPPALSFLLEAPGVFQRFFKGSEPRLSGTADLETLARAGSLMHRFRGASVSVEDGTLRIRATPGLEAGAIVDLVNGAADLVEGFGPASPWSEVEEGGSRSALRLKA